MKNLKLVLVVGICVAVALVLYLFIQHRGDPKSDFFEPAIVSTQPSSAAQSNVQSNSPASSNLQDQTPDSTGTDQSTDPSDDDPATQQKLSQFSAYIKGEALGLDRTNHQTEAKTVELRARALKLDATEKNHLKNISMDTTQPVNERILSVYLLSLTADITSQNLVSGIAQTPMPDLGPLTPHSESEIRNAQELALRYMAIDKLVENYKSNPPQSELAVAAMQSLQIQSTQNPTPQVRKYANDELNKLTK